MNRTPPSARPRDHESPGSPEASEVRRLRWEAPLSTDLDDPEAVPYFLWDEPMSVRELRQRLETASEPEKARLLGKILREARDWEVWKFTTPNEVVEMWPRLIRHLGRRRAFWTFLLDAWWKQGRVGSHVAG